MCPIARKERWPLRQHRPHRLRPYWAPAGVGASSRQLSSQRGYAGTQVCCSESAPDALSLTLLTVLTVLTVFSGHERIRITLLPARPSRLNANFDTEYPKERLSGRRGIRARCAVGPKRGDAAQDRHRFRRVLVSDRGAKASSGCRRKRTPGPPPFPSMNSTPQLPKRGEQPNRWRWSWMSRLGRARLVAASKRGCGCEHSGETGQPTKVVKSLRFSIPGDRLARSTAYWST